MRDCEYCGITDVLTRNCTYCGTEVCTKHILPENHDCPSLNYVSTDSKHLQSDIDANQRGNQSKSDTGNTADNGPAPLDQVQTHGGSGKDHENADFLSSPDVNPDGSLSESEVESIERDYSTEERGSTVWSHLNEYLWTYGSVVVILLILQFGFGIDVFGFLKQYFLP